MNRNRRHLILAAAIVAFVLYAWQVVSAWADADEVSQFQAAMSVRGLLAGRNPDAIELTGKGLAAGATGTLYFYSRGDKGILQVQDMPVLPAAQIYEVWCSDVAGKVDASSVFRISAEDQQAETLVVSAPRILSDYSRFLITIEPAGGSPAPSSQVVMAN